MKNDYLKLTEEKPFKHIKIKIRRRKIPYKYWSEKKKTRVHKIKLRMFIILKEHYTDYYRTMREERFNTKGLFYSEKRKEIAVKKKG